ncbi:MAG: hypothetical protein Q7S05_01030 [bacterium]|nr:hypothetical protein [bacterium]
MNKRKIFGILIVIFGVIMIGGSLGYEGDYAVMAPISMSLIVVAGLLMIFWDKVKAWMNKPDGGTPPPQQPSQQ